MQLRCDLNLPGVTEFMGTAKILVQFCIAPYFPVSTLLNGFCDVIQGSPGELTVFLSWLFIVNKTLKTLFVDKR